MMPSVEARSSKISRRKLVVIAAGLLVLVGIVIVAIEREATSRRLVAAAISRPTTPSRPPLTRAEETYIQALWPIHGAVERSSARMTLGQIFYVTKDLEQADLKARVDEALTTFRRAEGQLRALEPPPSLRGADDDKDFGKGKPGETVPPQTLPQGFESHRELAADATPSKHAAQYSAWIVESSRFMDVPHRSFMPDRGDPDIVNLPVNVGIILAKNGDITLYDTGWMQRSYIYDWNSGCCDKPLRDQMISIGLDPNHVKHMVIGHGHWDHAGQISEFPQATLYVQKEELKQIDFFLAYPLQFNDGHIHAVNTVERHSYTSRQDIDGGTVYVAPGLPRPNACARTSVCGYPPQTLHEIFDKVLAGQAKNIDGRHEVG